MPTEAPTETQQNGSAQVEEAQEKTEQSDTATESLTTQARVLARFKNEAPALYHVARCESRWRQFEQNGDVLRGRIDPNDVGVMQINERYHLESSKKLGYNIYTLEGNLGYAHYLYQKQGLQPWSASKRCWAGEGQIAQR